MEKQNLVTHDAYLRMVKDDAITAKKIISEQCKKYGITKKKVLSKNRRRYIVECRYSIMFRLRSELHLSLSKIGMILLRNHATIIHGIATYEMLKGTKQLLVETDS